MPLPSNSPGSSGHHSRSSSDNLIDAFNHCSVSDLEIGIPVDEVDERRIQEEQDAVRFFDLILYYKCNTYRVKALIGGHLWYRNF